MCAKSRTVSCVPVDPDTFLIRVESMIESTTNSNEFRSKNGTMVRIPDADFNIIPRSVTKNTTPCFTRIRTTTICVNNQGLIGNVTAVAEWYGYRTVACFVTGSSPVPLKTRRVGQRCTLNLSRAETSSRWCGVVVRRGGASSGVVHVT
ncbi:uncharacterized protein TNCV_3888621 [Trichonephila clavipes]|nr:uncharacterized protein TNCV_3888621 [Trichonephila clavipes]